MEHFTLRILFKKDIEKKSHPFVKYVDNIDGFCFSGNTKLVPVKASRWEIIYGYPDSSCIAFVKTLVL